MRNVDRLCLAHFWVAFGAFLFACLIGTWQMWVRSPLGAKIGTPGQYFMSVTAHGVAMAYVLTTFFIMGFGYFVAVTALNRPLPGRLGPGRRSGSRCLAWWLRSFRSALAKPRCCSPSTRR